MLLPTTRTASLLIVPLLLCLPQPSDENLPTTKAIEGPYSTTLSTPTPEPFPLSTTTQAPYYENYSVTIKQRFCSELNESSCEDLQSQILRLYEESIQFENFLGILIPIVFAIIIILGTIGNFFVIMIACGRQMRNSTNTLIIGLAVSDLMFLLICIPITALDYATSTWILPNFMCSVINYCQHISAYMSVWTLSLMAFDRFLAVCYPVESMTIRNTRNTTAIMIGLYVVIALSQVPVAFLHGIYTYEFLIETRSACAYVGIVTEAASKLETVTYFCTFNFFGYILPLAITVLFYAFMLRRLWHSPRPGNTSSVSSSVRSRPETIKNKKKVTRLVLIVIVTWAISWLPINVCFFLSAITYPDSLVVRFGKSAVVFQIGSQVLAYMNSSLNPFLYALMSENFRKGFVRIFARVTRRLTRGTMCGSESRTVSRMEITNANGQSIRRFRSNTMRHASSAPTCNETLPLSFQKEDDSAKSESGQTPDRPTFLRGAQRRIVRALQERNSIRFVDSTARKEAAAPTDSEPSIDPSVNVSDSMQEIPE